MDTPIDLPETVTEAIDDGMPPVRAIRQEAGRAQHDVAAASGMSDERLNEIEQGSAATSDELATFAEVLDMEAIVLQHE